MKTFLTKLFIFSLLIVSAVSCTKKDDPLPTQVVNLDTKGVHDITAISAVVDAKAKASCTERGVCWGKAPNPTLDDFHIANGSGKGEYSCTLTDLEPNQKYYYRAYAADGERIAYALDEKSFTTRDGIIHLTTGYVTDITAISATCSGNITDDGGLSVTERGFCWSTSPNPTLDNANAQHVAVGNGTGEFSTTLTSLTEYTKYYVCAYATNSQETSYGSNVSFTPGYLNFTANGVSFTMIPVDGGTFTMGATSEQGSDASAYEYPTHSVTLSNFYMGETEVTQALWQAVMGSNPSCFYGNNLPVETVDWNDSQKFITKLNALLSSQMDGRLFRLPTEAEWEYAARGGKKSQGYKYSGSNTLSDVAWYSDNSDRKTHAVGTKQANELGLYDMSGNVWEWCSDWYDGYGSSAQTNPTGPASGKYRVFRGGPWFDTAENCRVSYRAVNTPDEAGNGLGLRLSLR